MCKNMLKCIERAFGVRKENKLKWVDGPYFGGKKVSPPEDMSEGERLVRTLLSDFAKEGV